MFRRHLRSRGGVQLGWRLPFQRRLTKDGTLSRRPARERCCRRSLPLPCDHAVWAFRCLGAVPCTVQEKANAAKSATSKREPRAADPKDGSKEGSQQKKAKNINKGKVKAGQAARLQAGKNAGTPGAQQKPKEQKDTRPAGGSLFGHILTKARPACVVRPDSDHVAANQQSGAPGAGGHVFSGHGGLVSLVGGCAGAFLVVAAVGFGSYLKKQDAMENTEPPRETEMTPLFGEPQERGATGLGVTYSL